MALKLDPGLIPEKPDLSFESALWKEGLSAVAGIDEAGRGCLAGPVFAAAVILNSSQLDSGTLEDVQDSKKLAAKTRESLRALIEENSQAWGVGQSSQKEIDRYGILPATRLAISRALNRLRIVPDHLLVDYITLPDNPIPQTRLVKGDARSLSIAAASILAKTYRDQHMIEAGSSYPGYDFERNKGYGTAAHRRAIEKKGPSPIHRMSFSPLRVDDDPGDNRQLLLDLREKTSPGGSV